jgi:hypothetical protein
MRQLVFCGVDICLGDDVLMAAVTPNINQARAMRVAVRRIEGFAKQFGEAHRTWLVMRHFPSYSPRFALPNLGKLCSRSPLDSRSSCAAVAPVSAGGL